MSSSTASPITSSITSSTTESPHVWLYFRLAHDHELKKHSSGRTLHYCLSCPQQISVYSSHHPGNAIKHVKARHPDIYARLMPPPTSQPSITSYMNPQLDTTTALREAFDYHTYIRTMITLTHYTAAIASRERTLRSTHVRTRTR